jgi:ABC-2 type transport system permease protein
VTAVFPAATTTPRPSRTAARLAPAYRFELAKLLTQWRVRGVLLVCLFAPGAFVAVVSAQTTLPTDTVFGRWMHVSGWAGSLVVLAFACSWALPLVTSLVAGDVFAAEDRLGTWRHLLVAVRSPRTIFLAKALASLSVILLVVVALAASSTVGGLLAVGDRPLVGLDGQQLAGGDVVRAVMLAWTSVLAPTLAFAAVGLLGSVVLGRSPTGLLVPAVLALAMDLVLLLPVPVPVRLALPSNAFLAWRGLFADTVDVRPLLIGIVVSLVWAAVATSLAYRLFTRRDFADLAHDGGGGRALAVAVVPLAALVVLSTVALAAAAPPGAGIAKGRLETSLATTYAHLYRLQTEQLHRPAVTEADLHARADCDKGGSRVADHGPGHDWRCVVTWRLPGSSAEGTAIYQLDVAAEGRYVADGDGPQEVNGSFSVRTSTGDAPNPLWQLDGYVDLL